MKTYTLFDILDIMSKIERDYYALIPDENDNEYYAKINEWGTVIDIKEKLLNELMK